MQPNPFVFWILAAIAVGAALVTITRKNPLASALALAVSLVAVAGLFAGLAAHLLFILQILVYAGAIVVLIVFVIMLLNLREEDLAPLAVEKGKFAVAAIAAAAGCALVLRSLSGLPGLWRPVPPEFGTAQDVAGALFTRFLIPFEILGLILLVGIMGAVVLAKKGE